MTDLLIWRYTGSEHIIVDIITRPSEETYNKIDCHIVNNTYNISKGRKVRADPQDESDTLQGVTKWI